MPKAGSHKPFKRIPVSGPLSGEIVSMICDYEEGNLPEEDIPAFFQALIDQGTIHHLQGHYGRMAHALRTQGLVTF